MRKLLYTTTALVGAAFLVQAAPANAEIKVSGNYNAKLVFGEIAKDAPGKKQRGSQIKDGASLTFEASKDHPNGLTTGFKAVLDVDDATNVQTRESDDNIFDDVYGSVGGSFGKVYLGNVGDAGSGAHVGGTPSAVGFGVGDDTFGIGIGTDAVDSIISRQKSIKYTSPSFTGFSFGVSSAPETGKLGGGDGVDDDGDHNNAYALGLGYSNEFGGTSIKLSASFGATEAFPEAISVAKDESQFTSATAAASAAGVVNGLVLSSASTVGDANKAAKYYGVPFVMSLTAADSDALDAALDKSKGANDGVRDGSAIEAIATPATNSINTGSKRADEDGSAYSFGVEVGYQDFKFGGSWGQWEKQNNTDVTSWRLGGSYTVDAFTFGVGYGEKEQQSGAYVLSGTVADNTGSSGNASSAITDTKLGYDKNGGHFVETESLAFTVGYALGDGATLSFGIEADSRTTTGYNSDGQRVKNVKNDDFNETGFGVGIDLSF